MGINFKKSIGSPIAVDIGNQTTQGRVVSKTVQFGLFTTNENAVWGGNQQLQKESYPFAYISVSVNRNMFRLQVGDVFKFSYAKYGVSNMVCRVLQIEEEDLKSEKITIHAMEDIFSVSNAVTKYTDPEDNASEAPDYTIEPFTIQRIIESPYYVSGDSISVIPLASTDQPLVSGYTVYMSLDDGDSYSRIGMTTYLQPYGTLVAAYGLTYTIDDTEGFTVDFVSGQDTIETIGWADIFSGTSNIALLGDEFISFQSVTPVTETQYLLEGIIRGRFGSKKVAHSLGETFTVVSNGFEVLTHRELVVGATRKFKLVPFNSKYSGSIADMTAMTLVVEGVGKTPYDPINFFSDDECTDSRYDAGDDITLTWSPRFRSKGAGIGTPGVVLADDDYEGLFKVEVWVSAILVRTATDIDAVTWDYTNAMNVLDNTAAADEITFKLSNFIVDSGITYESDQVTVISTKN